MKFGAAVGWNNTFLILSLNSYKIVLRLGSWVINILCATSRLGPELRVVLHNDPNGINRSPFWESLRPSLLFHLRGKISDSYYLRMGGSSYFADTAGAGRKRFAMRSSGPVTLLRLKAHSSGEEMNIMCKIFTDQLKKTKVVRCWFLRKYFKFGIFWNDCWVDVCRGLSSD